MLRLYSLYEQYTRRRRLRDALSLAQQRSSAAGGPGSGSLNSGDAVSMIEFEMQQEQDRHTRVGMRLEGAVQAAPRLASADLLHSRSRLHAKRSPQLAARMSDLRRVPVRHAVVLACPGTHQS